MSESLAGKLILASPGMDDTTFSHAVILMVEHHDNGAVGLVLNQPTDTPVQEVWDQVAQPPCPVEQALRRGGPCPGPLMLLHNRPKLAQVRVAQGICFSAEEALVREIAADAAGPLGFYLGYAGWGPGQLEGELDQGAWIVAPASAAVVFDPDADDGLWMRVITDMDRALAMLALNPKLVPRDPSMN